MVSDLDMGHLRRCVALAREALEAGDEPFGSMLVSAEGDILYEDRNRVSGGDHTRHPEFAIARWAAEHLSEADRRSATVYTSGEHCPMCAAAHGWVGLGRIVYASSSEQLGTWLGALGMPPSPVSPLPIKAVVCNADVSGPALELATEIRELHAQRATREP